MSDRTAFVKARLEEIDGLLSGDALVLLLRMRREADQRESDGFIEDRVFDALLAYYRMKSRRVGRLLDELRAVGVIERLQTGWLDVNFASVHRTKDQRNALRVRWKEAQKSHRSQDQPSPMSSHDTAPDTHSDSSAESNAASSPSWVIGHGSSSLVTGHGSAKAGQRMPDPGASAAIGFHPSGDNRPGQRNESPNGGHRAASIPIPDERMQGNILNAYRDNGGRLEDSLSSYELWAERETGIPRARLVEIL